MMVKNFYDQAETATCRNCGHQPPADYCPNCGQRDAQRLTAVRVLGESFDKLLELDFGLLRTLRGLFLNPGKVVSDYLAGRRQYYANPLKFAFLMTTLNVAVVFFLEIDAQNFASTTQAQDQLGNEVFHFVMAIRSYIVFLIAFPVAIVASRVLRKTGINAAEFYTVFMFYFGLNMTVDTLLAIAGVYSLEWGTLAAKVLYFLLFLRIIRGLCGFSWLETAWRSSLIFASYILVSPLIVLPLFYLSRLLGLPV